MRKNNARRWVVISLVLTALGAGMTAAGILLDSMNFYWMVLVGLMLGITFLICFFVFRRQAKRLDAMFRKENLLAHWVLDGRERLQKAEEEFARRKKTNRKLLLIVTAFFVVIGGVFGIFGFDDPEDAVPFLIIILSVLAIIAFAALAAPGMAYRKMKKSSPEIFVGTDGAWVMGEFVVWKAPMTRLMEVGFEYWGSGSVIAIDYEVWQRYGYQRNTFHIPVPAGLEAQAFDVAQRIAAMNGVGFRRS
jgi:O-antigen/teichoic acid export membrane protein